MLRLMDTASRNFGDPLAIDRPMIQKFRTLKRAVYALATLVRANCILTVALAACLVIIRSPPVLGAVTFNSNEYLTTSETPVTATPLTIAVRYKRNLGQGYARGLISILATATSDSSGFILRHNTSTPNSRANAMQRNGGSGTTSVGGHITNGSWTTIVGVFDVSSYVVFEGGAEGSATSGPTPSGLSLINIGKLNGLTAQGDCADYAIWSRALTDDEVALYDSGMQPPGIHCDDLEFWWEARAHDEAPRIGPSLTANGTLETATHPTTFYPPWFVVRN